MRCLTHFSEAIMLFGGSFWWLPPLGCCSAVLQGSWPACVLCSCPPLACWLVILTARCNWCFWLDQIGAHPIWSTIYNVQLYFLCLTISQISVVYLSPFVLIYQFLSNPTFPPSPLPNPPTISLHIFGQPGLFSIVIFEHNFFWFICFSVFQTNINRVDLSLLSLF